MATTGDITGRVVDANGNGIEGVVVTPYDVTPPRTADVTDATGAFLLVYVLTFEGAITFTKPEWSFVVDPSYGPWTAPTNADIGEIVGTLTEDPFTLVARSIWDTLEAHTRFADLVPANNRIKLIDGARDPIKDQISVEDLPEVRMLPAGSSFHAHRTSNSTSCMQRYALQVSTGDIRMNKWLFPVKWIIFRALKDWPTTLGTVLWNTKVFVKNVILNEAADGINEADLSRGIKGWSTIWSCEVEMWFTTGDL